MRELGKLGHEPAQRIAKFLFERVAPLDDPRSIGEALKGSELGDFWKYREAIRIGREGLHKTQKAEATWKSEGHSADAAQPPERNPWRRPAASRRACARIVASRRAGRRPSGAQLVAQTGRRLAMSPAHQRGVPVSSQASMQSAHIQQ